VNTGDIAGACRSAGRISADRLQTAVTCLPGGDERQPFSPFDALPAGAMVVGIDAERPRHARYVLARMVNNMSLSRQAVAASLEARAIR